MKSIIRWQDGMAFTAECDENSVAMDSKPPLGKKRGMTPKELVAAGLGGCTAMDVIALLKKHKQSCTGFSVDVEITSSDSGHPVVFSAAQLTFRLEGEIESAVLLESIRLSQTKYCGVSAMLSKALPITYEVILNGEKIGEGKANF